MKKGEWIHEDVLRDLEAEGTNAHRLCTNDDGWVERFSSDVLISHKTEAARERLVSEFNSWQRSMGVTPRNLFARFLPKKNEERETPKLLSGNESESVETIATENHLRFGIDFAAGYSVGLFVDQRENRRFVREIKPKHVLNCFAYTCAFSVAAAAAGAKTVNVDLSKKSLERGRHNFALNELSTDGHQFIADDVRPVLRRLARRGEKFDMIILDPPTFSRTKGGAAFHVEKDLEELIANAIEITDRNAKILISTNCETLPEPGLERMASYALKLSRRSGAFHRQPPPVDFPPGAGAKTVWLSLH
jgi:23S rRNA (cytosine1962-C5)-methyltransferase